MSKDMLLKILRDELIENQDGTFTEPETGAIYESVEDYFEYLKNSTESEFAAMKKELEKVGSNFQDEVNNKSPFAIEWLNDPYIGEELREKYLPSSEDDA